MQLTTRKTATRFEFDRADWLAVAGIVVLALLPRLLLTLALPPILHLDSDSYFEITARLWNTGSFGDLSRRTPLYPLLLAMVSRSPRIGIFPVVLVQHLFGIASAILVYLIARRFSMPDPAPAHGNALGIPNRVAAAVAGSLAAVVIFPAILEHSILSESLYTVLLLAAAYLSIQWLQEQQTWTAIAGGAALGLAALTRPIAAGVFAVWAAYMLVVLGARRGLRFVLLGGTAFLVLVLPLMVRNRNQQGRFALTQSLGRNLISVTDTLVDYDRGVQPQIKAIYRQFLADKRGPDAVVVYAAMPRLRSATHWSDVQIDRALAEIAWEAIKAHPLRYSTGAAQRLPLLFRSAGMSQWHALHPETYLPLVEFIGRLNPDLVSRSVALQGLRQARFALAERGFRVFGMDLTNGWMMSFVVLGMIVAVVQHRREAGLLVTLLAFLWIATVLLQPPNGRYRLPTLGLEILFAAAGWWFVLELLLRIGQRWIKSRQCFPANLADCRGGPCGRPGQPQESPLSPAPGQPQGLPLRTAPLFSCAQWCAQGARLSVVLIGMLAIVAMRAALAAGTKPIFDIAAWQKQWPAQGGTTGLQFRDAPMAGRVVPVLYWNGMAGDSEREAQAVTARVPVDGGRSYRLRAAYSCERKSCSGATLRFTFLDSAGAAVGDIISQPLAQERSDNDLFWDQLEMTLPAPRAAREGSVELIVSAGGGNFVMPYLSVEPSRRG